MTTAEKLPIPHYPIFYLPSYLLCDFTNDAYGYARSRPRQGNNFGIEGNAAVG